MQSYTLIFSSCCGENIEDSEFESLLKKVSATYSCPEDQADAALCAVRDHYYTVLLPCCIENQENVKPEWHHLNSITTFRTHTETCLKCIRQEGTMEKLLEHLHHLANSLPKLGCFVDLLWIENSTWPQFESNLDLYGALKRYSEWNHARVSLVGVEQEVTGCDVWIESIGAEKQALRCEEEIAEKILWRGSIKLKSAQSLKPLTLPGFRMLPYRATQHRGLRISSKPEATPPQHLLSPCMELMVPLDIQEIPSFYISSPPRQIAVSDSTSPALNKSRQFLGLLQQNSKLCYLLRLAYGSSWNEKSLSDPGKKSAQSWMDALLDNVNAVYEPPYHCELSGDTGHEQFLVVAGEDPDLFLAYPVRRLSSISAAPFHHIALGEMQGLYGKVGLGKENSEKIATMLSGLPHFSAHSLMKIQAEVEDLQAKVLHAWIDEHDGNKEISLGTLSQLLSSTRQYYVKRILQDPALTQPFSPQADLPSFQLLQPIPEYENQFELVEKLVLGCRKAATDIATASNDSLGGLSPPTKNKVLTLNAEEFLKFFKPNGEARKEPKSVLSIKKNPMCKYDSIEAKNAPWTDYAVHSNYHDIYYHQGEISDKLEEKTARLRARLLPIETSSTCSIEQANSPASIVLQASPTPQAKADAIKSSEAKEKDKRSPGHRRKSLVQVREQKEREKRKRKADEPADAKSLYASKKQRLDAEKSTAKKEENTRSMRHKKKLEDVVTNVLASQGIDTSSPMFKPCMKKLYTITYTFVKDLRGYTSLRAEMEKIAKSNVEMVVAFQRSQQK